MQSETLTARNFDTDRTDRQELRWVVVASLALITLGSAAVIYEMTATIVSILLLGAVLLAAGLMLIGHALRDRASIGFFPILLDGILRTVVGGLLIVSPEAGALSLTLVLSFYFVAGGIVRAIASAVIRFPRSGWSVLSGLVSVVLGALLVLQWPASGLWFIGFVVGLDLIVSGWSLLMFASVVSAMLPRKATMMWLVLAGSTALLITAVPVQAQESQSSGGQYELPKGWVASSTPGSLREPALLSKFAMSTESSTGGESRDGFYGEFGNMITGEGWISAGPGYRRKVLDGRARIDMSAALSWNLYKMAQGSFELPHLLKDRLSIGGQVRYQDVLQVEYFGAGNNSLKSDQSAYRFNNLDVVAFGRLQPNRWLSFDARAGWIPRPDLSNATGPRVLIPNTTDIFTEATAPGLRTQPSFIHTDISVVADTRDHPGHPTVGGYYRATGGAYVDQSAGAYSFRRYEVEAAQFVPLGTRKVVLALHGWEVFSATSAGATVPFYLMPSLGGKNTLRGFHDYRFHDNDLQNFNVETRWALLTHMDLAAFADTGKVAPDASGLDFRGLRRSYGAGVRFHNATSTLLRVDAGHSSEGWLLFIKVSDSFKRSTPASDRASVVPFVP